VALKYLNKAQSALAISAIMRSTSTAGGAPGKALSGAVPLAFAAGNGSCNFSSGAAVAAATNKPGAVEVGTLNDTSYNGEHVHGGPAGQRAGQGPASPAVCRLPWAAPLRRHRALLPSPLARLAPLAHPSLYRPRPNAVTFGPITGAFKGIGLSAARASYTLTGLALQLAAPSKVAVNTGLPKRVAMAAKVLAGSLAVEFSFKAKGGEAVAMNFSLPLASLGPPTKGPACSVGLSASGALSLSCPLLSVPFAAKAIDTGVDGAAATLTLTLSGAPRAKFGAGTPGAAAIAGGIPAAAPAPPAAANDTATWDARGSPPACKAYALANDALPDALSTRVLMACNNKTVELDNPVINLEPSRAAEAGCEFADGSAVAWATDYAGSEDPLRNGTLFAEQYYFVYYPPSAGSYNSTFTASFNYTLRAGGASSTATVSCVVPAP
jgi:hypothetical protein